MHFSALRQARQKLSVRSLDMVADTRRTSRSEEGFEAVVKNLAQFCGSNVHSTPVSQRHAAVLVPLFEQQSGDVRVLLTKVGGQSKKLSIVLPPTNNYFNSSWAYLYRDPVN